jgi:tetratricopeptide (TPR) repeat protein
VTREENGPSAAAIAFFGLAGILGVVALVLWIKRPAELGHIDAVPTDARVDTAMIAVVQDAGVAGATLDARAPAPADAAERVPADAAPSVRAPADAAPVDPASPAARSAQSKALLDEANAALKQGQFDLALERADAAITLWRTARGFLVRAQAQQRLGKIPDALASVDSAEKLAPESANVWYTRGSILWAARRWDDAHDAYNRFLEIEDEGSRADMVRRRLAEPH